MAIDTRDKRSSAIHPSSPWRCQFPLADGAIGQGDRQHTAWIYSGILAAALDVTPDVTWTLQNQGQWVANDDGCNWTVIAQQQWRPQ